MSKKNISLLASIVTFLVFIGFLGESKPHSMFGFLINIWFVRLAWLIVAVLNIRNYLKLRKLEK